MKKRVTTGSNCLRDPKKKDSKRCMFVVKPILSPHDLKGSQMTPNDFQNNFEFIRHIESHLSHATLAVLSCGVS